MLIQNKTVYVWLLVNSAVKIDVLTYSKELGKW